MKKFMTIFGLVWILALGACTSSSNEADDNDVDVIEQEPEVESEVEESKEETAVVTSFRDTEFGEGLEGYYGFTIVEEMNDGVTAYVIAESQSRNFRPDAPDSYGTITFYLVVEHDELFLKMETRYTVTRNLFERQERSLGIIDLDSVADLSFLDEDTLTEISKFIYDNFYELSATKNELSFQWSHATSRFFTNGNISSTISNLPDVTQQIEGEEMKVQSVTDDFLVFNREDSTVKDSQGNLIAQGYRVSHEDDPVYDGQISFEDDDLDAVFEAIRALATEPEMEAPW